MAYLTFWFGGFLIVYHHLLYPLLLRTLAHRNDARYPAAAPVIESELPSITVIVPCHNEASVIERKIENLADLDYPRAKLTIVLALDGCTDATRSLAQRGLTQTNLRYEIVTYETNIGKVGVLNDQIRGHLSDIIALSDASSLVNPGALRTAASHFGNPAVGVVSGSYCVNDAANPGEQAYWKYQITLKTAEARFAAPMGAHGAFYFFRRRLWTELPADTINDDFVLPMRIVADGYRAIYDPAIECRELETAEAKQEFRRRIRIGAGNLQQVLRMPALSSPRLGRIAFAFWSGKGLRAIMPLVLFATFVGSLVLAHHEGGIYVAIVAAEFLTIGSVLVAAFLPTILLPSKLRVLSYLFTGYIAAGIGCLLLMTGYSSRVWEYSRSAKDAALARSPEPGTPSIMG